MTSDTNSGRRPGSRPRARPRGRSAPAPWTWRRRQTENLQLNGETRFAVAKSVGIRRQAREDVDAREAVGGAGRAVGADRASAAGEAVAFPLSRPQAGRRLRAWQQAGVWERLHELLLAELHASDQLEWERAIADSSHLQAKKGAPQRVRARSTAVAPAASTTCS